MQLAKTDTKPIVACFLRQAARGSRTVDPIVTAISKRWPSTFVPTQLADMRRRADQLDEIGVAIGTRLCTQK